MSVWINVKGKYVEQRTEPAPVKRTAPKAASPEAWTMEVKLFEAVRDVHLALAEFRIALALEKKALPEKIAALRKELDSLETCIDPSDASVAARLFIKRAVNRLKRVLAANTSNPLVVSRASRGLLDCLSYLEKREAQSDAEFRARVLAIAARIGASNDQAEFGIS